jgi:hypothetical protein
VSAFRARGTRHEKIERLGVVFVFFLARFGGRLLPGAFEHFGKPINQNVQETADAKPDESDEYPKIGGVVEDAEMGKRNGMKHDFMK